MELTGECKSEFDFWAQLNEHGDIQIYKERVNFNKLTDSMKYGVLSDFLRSEGLYLIITPEDAKSWVVQVLKEDIMSPFYEVCEDMYIKTIEEARIRAIEKANEIYNEKEQC